MLKYIHDQIKYCIKDDGKTAIILLDFTRLTQGSFKQKIHLNAVEFGLFLLPRTYLVYMLI